MKKQILWQNFYEIVIVIVIVIVIIVMSVQDRWVDYGKEKEDVDVGKIRQDKAT